MFGSEILDVAIGLALVYLLLSFFATAVREAVESVVKARAVYLERGIRELLDDHHDDARKKNESVDEQRPDMVAADSDSTATATATGTGNGLTKRLYDHPLIAALYPGTYTTKEGFRFFGRDFFRRRFFGHDLPTYIPSRNFAVALLDLVRRGDAGQPYPLPATEDAMRAAAMQQPVGVRRALLVAIDGTDGDAAAVQANLAAWFDSAMDRVSGRYKRFTQFWLLAIGLAVAIGLDVDTIAIANHLARSKAARETLVERARVAAANPRYATTAPAAPNATAAATPPNATAGASPDAAAQLAEANRRYEDLAALDLPLRGRPDPTAPPEPWYVHWIGLALTAFAVSLGAPFWFDTLNKLMVVRSTVKPHEKSGEEGSADRTSAPAKAPTTLPSTPVWLAPVSVAPATLTSGNGDGGGDAFVPHEWATGNPNAGVL